MSAHFRKLTVAMLALGVVAAGAAACAPRGPGSSNVQRITMPSRDDHGVHFPIADGPHAQASCNDCHGEGDSFTQFSCTTCHTNQGGGDTVLTQTDANHGGVGGYQYDSASCLVCHPKGTADGSAGDHNLFPIGQGAVHSGLACGSCHLDASDRTQITCTGCHLNDASGTAKLTQTDSNHAAVGGYGYDTGLCLRCHGDSQVSPIAQHHTFNPQMPFSLAQGAPHYQSPRSLSCLVCHPNMRTQAQANPPAPAKPFAADFASAECLGCHTNDASGSAKLTQTDNNHAGVGGYSYASPACQLCHGDGTAGSAAPADHNTKDFPLPHNGASCTQCHTDPSNRQVVTCTGCHTSGGTTNVTNTAGLHTSVRGFQATDAMCLRCHADDRVEQLAQHTHFSVTHQGAKCLQCHSATRTDEPWGADFGTPALNCGFCHTNANTGEDITITDAKHAGVSGYSYLGNPPTATAGATCFGCHGH